MGENTMFESDEINNAIDDYKLTSGSLHGSGSEAMQRLIKLKDELPSSIVRKRRSIEALLEFIQEGMPSEKQKAYSVLLTILKVLCVNESDKQKILISYLTRLSAALKRRPTLQRNIPEDIISTIVSMAKDRDLPNDVYLKMLEIILRCVSCNPEDINVIAQAVYKLYLSHRDAGHPAAITTRSSLIGEAKRYVDTMMDYGVSHQVVVDTLNKASEQCERSQSGLNIIAFFNLLVDALKKGNIDTLRTGDACDRISKALNLMIPKYNPDHYREIINGMTCMRGGTTSNSPHHAVEMLGLIDLYTTYPEKTYCALLLLHKFNSIILRSKADLRDIGFIMCELSGITTQEVSQCIDGITFSGGTDLKAFVDEFKTALILKRVINAHGAPCLDLFSASIQTQEAPTAYGQSQAVDGQAPTADGRSPAL